jgi:hypothetical protein
VWPSASSGDCPDIVESSSSEEFGILSWPRAIQSACGCERPSTRLRSKSTPKQCRWSWYRLPTDEVSIDSPVHRQYYYLCFWEYSSESSGVATAVSGFG